MLYCSWTNWNGTQNDIQNILVLESNTTICYINSRWRSIIRRNRCLDLLHLPFPKVHFFLVFLHILRERERERERERIVTKAVFVLGVKRIWKMFYTMMSVWVGRKIQSNGKSFLVIVKYQPFRCKINYISNLPSDHIHPFSSSTQTKREREKRRAPTVEHRESRSHWKMDQSTMSTQ